VVEHPGLLLSQHNHPPRTVGKPLKHLHTPDDRTGNATTNHITTYYLSD
jgi:hypothetical protein